MTFHDIFNFRARKKKKISDYFSFSGDFPFLSFSNVVSLSFCKIQIGRGYTGRWAGGNKARSRADLGRTDGQGNRSTDNAHEFRPIDGKTDITNNFWNSLQGTFFFQSVFFSALAIRRNFLTNTLKRQKRKPRIMWIDFHSSASTCTGLCGGKIHGSVS